MKRLFLFSVVVFGSVLPVMSWADVLGGRVGVNLWNQGYDGNVGSGGEQIDLERDLGYDDETGSSFYAQFEHPLPLLPNLMLVHTDVDAQADGFLNGVEFDDIVYTGDVDSTIDISHTDFTFYYEVLDNWVNLDLGITGRHFSEGLSITDANTGLTGKLDLDDILPMVYGEARFDLPLTGLSVGVVANGVSFDGDVLYDLQAKVAYTFAFGLGLEAGYRVFDLDYDDDDEFADVSIEGGFAGVYWDF